VILGRPFTHVQSRLGNDRLHRHHLDAVNPRQIHARNPLQFCRQMVVNFSGARPGRDAVDTLSNGVKPLPSKRPPPLS
jgi:hypothetical protein